MNRIKIIAATTIIILSIVLINNISHGIISYYLPLFLIYLIGLLIICSVFIPKEKINIKNFLKNKKLPFLSSILLIALIVRIWRLGQESLWVDEVWHAYSAMLAVNENSLLKAFEIYGKSHLVTAAAYASGSIFSFSNEFFLRLPFALLGVLSVFFAYLLGKEFKNAKVGLIFAWITALSPMLIMQSRNIRFYILMQILVMLVLYLYLKFFRTKDNKILYAILSVIIISIFIVPSYFLIIVPFLLLHYLISNRGLFEKKIKFKKSFIAIFFLISGTIGYFFFEKFSWILDENSVHGPMYYFENIFIYEFIFMIIALMGIPKNFKKTWHLYLALTSILTLLCFSPLQYPKYYLFLLPILYLLSSLSLYDFYEKYKNKSKYAGLACLFVIIILPVYNFSKFNIYNSHISLDENITIFEAPNNPSFLLTYFNGDFFKLNRDPLLIKADYKKSLQFIREDSQNTDSIIIAESPQTLKYYNKLFSQNNKLIHPYYSYSEISGQIAKNDKPVYAIVGYRIKLDEQHKVDQETKNLIFKKMRLIKKFNGIEIYKL